VNAQLLDQTGTTTNHTATIRAITSHHGHAWQKILPSLLFLFLFFFFLFIQYSRAPYRDHGEIMYSPILPADRVVAARCKRPFA